MSERRLGDSIANVKDLATYSAYIDEFVRKADKEGWRRPGEHHFVATYLLPRLNRITRRTPYYVNPDGMKGVIGDVIYQDSRGQVLVSVEVKFLDVRLTATEFQKGIRSDAEKKWPTFFLGIGDKGLYIQAWGDFRETYIRLKYGGKVPRKNPEPGKYGLQIKVDKLLKIGDGDKFLHSGEATVAANREKQFFEMLAEFVRDAALR